ncbi:MAG: tryptophan synthase subunit alpha [Bryobacteraceae bacterium]|nr:tryptophan synthase subunit alpha [Bryobacteraceae bacterium]
MRIRPMFERLRAEGRPALIAYLTAGDPAPARTPALVAALERGGVDLIELGVPFSDPVADGPVIQAASERALKAGTNLRIVLEIAEQIREHSQIPILLFTYLNPVLRYGAEALAKDAARAGVDGVLLTDLSVEEAARLLPAFRGASLDTVFLASPTSTRHRLEQVASLSTGFIYIVSRTGVTGERDTVSGSIEPLVASLRAITEKPLAVGFGISRPEHAAQVGRLADGVVVGSAVVRMIEENRDSKDLETKLQEYAQSLSSALHGVKA